MAEDALADLVRVAPRPARPEVARTRVAEWQASAPAEAQALVEGRPPLRALLDAVADHSPYLWRLVLADPERLAAMLGEPPERTLARLFSSLAAALDGAPDMSAALSIVRRAKAEAALLVALADLGGAWDLEQILDALTRFADAAVAGSVRYLLRDAARAGRLVLDSLDPERGCGVTVLALGKGGGRELNYSSDIDLVVLYDPRAPALSEGVAAAPFYVKLTQGLVRLLGERTADGYGLRVDLRLRPDPGSTAIAISLAAAFSYYESFGQNWERAAYIKARPVGGDAALGRRFLDDLAPFIWRKYFDYAAIADIHAMKRQIHAMRGHAEVSVAGHDVKVGRGGIREIEFFVQTQQLIFGGRRPALRGSRTLEMLRELGAEGWVSDEAVAALAAAYTFLRTIEHRLQMLADEQTQRLPTEPDALAAFALWAGFDDLDAFVATATAHLRAVERHYAQLFEHAPSLDVDAGSLVFAGPAADPETVETLRRLGFARPEEAVETVRGWHFGRRPSVRTPRAREVLTELVPALLQAFAGSGDPDGALSGFDSLLGRLPGAVELFSILRQNATIRELFADILGVAPRLAAAVARRPHLLDAAIEPVGARDHASGRETRLAVLDPTLPTEEFLDLARDVAGEEMFLVGTRLLAGTLPAEQAGREFSHVAEAVVRATLDHGARSFATEYGVVPGARCVVVGLGRLGSREMTAASDLDLMLIYDIDPARGESDGPRRIDAGRYYARLTQRLIAALTATTRRGRLYEVDMRLRPSGRQGPVATRFSAFRSYQETEAELWEHMALTRARVVAGDEPLRAEVEAAIAGIVRRPRGDEVEASIGMLRALVAREKGEADGWDLKLAAGGILDIDFIAQGLILRHVADHPSLLDGTSRDRIAEGGRLGLLAASAADALGEAYGLYTRVLHILRLTTDGRFDAARAGMGLRRRLVAAADVPDFATLERELETRRAHVRRIFHDRFGASK